MTLIREVVKKALKTGYLTIEAEEQLRYLLTNRYDLEDLNAFMTLQEAAMMGQVKQESRERLGSYVAIQNLECCSTQRRKVEDYPRRRRSLQELSPF